MALDFFLHESMLSKCAEPINQVIQVESFHSATVHVRITDKAQIVSGSITVWSLCEMHFSSNHLCFILEHLINTRDHYTYHPVQVPLSPSGSIIFIEWILFLILASNIHLSLTIHWVSIMNVGNAFTMYLINFPSLSVRVCHHSTPQCPFVERR